MKVLIGSRLVQSGDYGPITKELINFLRGKRKVPNEEVADLVSDFLGLSKYKGKSRDWIIKSLKHRFNVDDKTASGIIEIVEKNTGQKFM